MLLQRLQRTALILHLHITQVVSFERLVRLMSEVFGLEISEGAIDNVLKRAAPALTTAAGGHRR